MKLLLYPAVEAKRLEKIRTAAHHMQVTSASNLESALAEIADADGFFGKITPELLRAARRLRWVQAPTSSLGGYLFPELIDHPCVLTSMRGLFSDIITDHVFGFILCFTRNFHRYIRNQVQGRWQAVGCNRVGEDLTTGLVVETEWDRAHPQLSGTTLGIVGLGQVGSEVARRGLAFGMRIQAIDPVQTKALAGLEKLWPQDGLKGLLAESDFVVITAPHTRHTVKMFRSDQFRQMKRTAYLINVGRGVIVDLDDLTVALDAGHIAGAGLDVFDVEPLPADHPLWGMENVIITPHVAGYAPKLPERFLDALLENVERFALGKTLRNVVSKRLGF